MLLLTSLLAALLQPTAPAQTAPICVVSGIVTAGSTPLPGVVVSLVSGDGTAVDVSASNADGSYTLRVPAPGTYTLKGELMAFAPLAEAVVLDAANCSARVNAQMRLRSRAPATPSPEATAPAAPAPMPGTPPSSSATPAPGGAPAGGARARGQGRGQGAAQRGQGGQQFQSLALNVDQNSLAYQGAGEDSLAQAVLPPGFSLESSSESVTTSASNRASDSLFGPGGPGERFGLGLPEGMDAGSAAQLLGLGGPGIAFAGAGGPGGGFGGPGGGPGGFAVGGGPGGFGPGGPGGPGGGFGGPFGGARGRNQIRGMALYSVDSSHLDSGPYALNGQAIVKPEYLQQRFGATIGGPLSIPKLLPGNTRTFFFINYTGNHSSNPYDQYSTVPTVEQRNGDLSSLTRTIVDPSTGLPFGGNVIPSSRLNPAAQSLLNLFPLPNQDGDRRNFHYVSTTDTQMDDINVRFVHNFGTATPRRPGQGAGGGRGAAGGRGGFGPGGGKNLNVALHYRHSDSSSLNPFPSLGGDTRSNAWDIPAGFSFTTHGIVNQLRVQYNRQHSEGQNLFAFTQDIAGLAGLQGVSNDPFDWGAPSISLSSFSGLRDMSPSTRTDQTIAVSESMLKTIGKHTMRWGGDYRDIRFDSRVDANANGSFVFTGLFTGADFADFLLGLPQQATLQYIAGPQRFRSTSWDAFFQDDWRVARNFTINAGLRYEYFSPVSEADDKLATLDVTPDFTAAAPVLAGRVGPYSGQLPDTIVRPFRTGFAPRVGVAWRAPHATVVRSGYGINYSSRTYQTIATQLASQPPFATTGTVLTTVTSPQSFESVLGSISPGATNNTYGVDPNYRMGYVQIWNLDVQHDLSRTFTLAVGYVGTKGSDLDILRAPNRGPDGLRIEGVPPFIWQSSGATSIMNMFTARLRKRLSHGVAFGAAYTLSKSIDDASSIGGTNGVVAQNDLDLAAERGLSSFDQRHRFTGDFTYQLPFGENQRWLNNGGAMATLLGSWTFNGNVQFASGTPYTARVLAAIQDVARGTNGTLRANYNGQPVALDDPTTMLFFNTAAFSIPASGTFGDVGRNTIIGPGTSLMNLGVTRNVALGGNRSVAITLLANNVLNTVQFAAIDTVVNSPTFGQVTAVRPMRTMQVTARFRF